LLFAWEGGIMSKLNDLLIEAIGNADEHGDYEILGLSYNTHTDKDFKYNDDPTNFNGVEL